MKWRWLVVTLTMSLSIRGREITLEQSSTSLLAPSVVDKLTPVSTDGDGPNTPYFDGHDDTVVSRRLFSPLRSNGGDFKMNLANVIGGVLGNALGNVRGDYAYCYSCDYGRGKVHGDLVGDVGDDLGNYEGDYVGKDDDVPGNYENDGVPGNYEGDGVPGNNKGGDGGKDVGNNVGGAGQTGIHTKITANVNVGVIVSDSNKHTPYISGNATAAAAAGAGAQVGPEGAAAAAAAAAKAGAGVNSRGTA